jgi:hypothetical protein
MGKTQPTVEWDKLPLMLDESKAATVLGVSVSFLRKSRCEGYKKVTLGTVNDEETAPPFVKIGGRVKYPTNGCIACRTDRIVDAGTDTDTDTDVVKNLI